MDEEQIINEQPHSVEISTNAKGEKSWEVKIYDADPARALIRAKNLDEQLEDYYRKE